eukprot:TRINITY_DN24825_c0_g1_i1.p1 TRINITY_DN24825_c0_g1~~TRINITY_DN24825_c0_g1_i1.p1  ORF type:complete len:931 (+),score=269.42 TRINITY_DN24825_c0_g1_i1:79-2871(+)
MEQQGNVKCSRCDGTGRISRLKLRLVRFWTCPKCGGTGWTASSGALQASPSPGTARSTPQSQAQLLQAEAQLLRALAAALPPSEHAEEVVAAAARIQAVAAAITAEQQLSPGAGFARESSLGEGARRFSAGGDSLVPPSVLQRCATDPEHAFQPGAAAERTAALMAAMLQRGDLGADGELTLGALRRAADTDPQVAALVGWGRCEGALDTLGTDDTVTAHDLTDYFTALTLFERLCAGGAAPDGIVPQHVLREVLRSDAAAAQALGLPPNPSGFHCRALYDEIAGGQWGADGVAHVVVSTAPLPADASLPPPSCHSNSGHLSDGGSLPQVISGIRFVSADRREHEVGVVAEADCAHRFELRPGEWIVEVRGRAAGGLTHGVQFVTNTGRASDWLGGRSGSQFSFRAKAGSAVLAVRQRGSPADWPLIGWIDDRGSGTGDGAGFTFLQLLSHLTSRVAEQRGPQLAAALTDPEDVANCLFDLLPPPAPDGTVSLPAVAEAIAQDEVLRLELNFPLSRGQLALRRHLMGPGAVWESERIPENRVREFIHLRCIFNAIDSNGSGYIDPTEFGEAMRTQALSAALKVPPQDAADVFTLVDKDRSGAVTFAEFAKHFAGQLADMRGIDWSCSSPAGGPAAGQRYQLVRRLGEGSFGVTYLAKRLPDGLPLALKRQKPPAPGQQWDSSAERAAWEAEAVMLQRLKHPHIVRFVEAVWQDGLLDIVMEYAGGGDLSTRLAGGPIPVSTAARYFRETAEAVRYLHDRRVIHRDIKPGNIFLTEGNSIKLGDVGLTQKVAAGRERLREVCGTWQYCAPELMRLWVKLDEGGDCGSGDYSYGVDCYALGCVLYELGTRRKVFPDLDDDGSPLSGEALLRIEQRIMDGDGCPLDSPLWCRHAVEGLLDPDSERRMSADEALRILAPPTAQADPAVLSDASG